MATQPQMNIERKILLLQDSLSRLLGWISAAESRISMIFAIDTAMLGLLSVLVPTSSGWSCWVMTISIITAMCLLISLLFLVFSSFPRTKGPKRSLIYFGGISERDLDSFKQEIVQLSDDQYLTDLIAQCHKNAQIAQKKYRWIQRSMVALYLSIVPWLLSILLLYQLKP